MDKRLREKLPCSDFLIFNWTFFRIFKRSAHLYQLIGEDFSHITRFSRSDSSLIEGGWSTRSFSVYTMRLCSRASLKSNFFWFVIVQQWSTPTGPVSRNLTCFGNKNTFHLLSSAPQFISSAKSLPFSIAFVSIGGGVHCSLLCWRHFSPSSAWLVWIYTATFKSFQYLANVASDILPAVFQELQDSGQSYRSCFVDQIHVSTTSWILCRSGMHGRHLKGSINAVHYSFRSYFLPCVTHACLVSLQDIA